MLDSKEPDDEWLRRMVGSKIERVIGMCAVS